MSADSLGNDVGAVGLPVSGFFGFAPAGTTFPTATLGKAKPLVLDAAFKKAGLLTTDGGFNWTMEPDGDPIEFFQDGYSIPSGLASVTLTAKLAEYSPIVRELTWGKTPDANGYITIDGGGHATRYVLFTEEIFKNGVIVRRVAADAGVTSVQQDQTTRGEVKGTEVTFTVARSALLANEHIGEWLIPTA